MSRVVSSISATALLAASLTVTASASADGGAGGHASWTIQNEAGSSLSGDGTFGGELPDYRINASGSTSSKITLGLSGLVDRDRWRVEFQGDSDHPLTAGSTYVATPESPFEEGHGPNLMVDRYWECAPRVGSFTIHEAAYDGGLLTRLNVSFAQRCLGHPGWIRGAIAWNATDAAHPLPSVPDPVAPTDPVANLVTEPDIGGTMLRWDKSPDLDINGVVICSDLDLNGAACPEPHSWDIEWPVVGRNWNYAGWNPNRTLTFTVWSRNVFGQLGPPVSVTLHGSRLSLTTSAARVASGSTLELRGRLVDSDTGQGLAGVPVDLYAAPVGTVNMWRTLGHPVTDEDGYYELSTMQRGESMYQARFHHWVNRPGNVSRMTVPAGTDVVLNSGEEWIRKGKAIRLRARAAPHAIGRNVVFQRKVGQRWVRVGLRSLDRRETAQLRLRVSKKGRVVLRAVRVIQPGVFGKASKPVAVRVRG